MSTEPSRLTDDERKKLTRIPDNTETRDVLENLLFSLSLMGILTDENIHQIIRNRQEKIHVCKERPIRIPCTYEKGNRVEQNRGI